MDIPEETIDYNMCITICWSIILDLEEWNTPHGASMGFGSVTDEATLSVGFLLCCRLIIH